MFEHDFRKYPELTNSELETLRFVSPHRQIEGDFRATVVKVHDGDTVTLRTEFRDFDFPLRFLEVDAPELNAGGEVSRDWLASKVLEKQVTIMINPDNRVDKYGRLLGRIFENGMDVAQEMVYLGLAVPFERRREGQLQSLQQLFSLRQWF